MKYSLIVFLVLLNALWAEEKELKNNAARTLTGFHEFKVITSLPFVEKLDRQLIYDAMANSFKKHGRVTITEKAPVFQHILQMNNQDTPLLISIDKKGDLIIGIVEIMAEVQIQKNKEKTASPIWKRKFFAPIPENQENSIEKAIGNLFDEIVETFSKDLTESKQTVFHIQKCEDM